MSTLEDRPWEQPGELRRDAEPHRGRILYLLAAATSVSGILTPFLAISFCMFPLPYRSDLCFLIMLVLSGAGLLLNLALFLFAAAVVAVRLTA